MVTIQSKVPSLTFPKISKLNAHISHCPISNLRLGCGIAKIDKMIELGINVSLGTDGQGSGSNLDMFEQMKFASLLQKGMSENPKCLPAYEVLKMATINGAKALKLDKVIGSIDIGKKADIIIINPNSEVANPINDVFATIVYNIKGNNVETTLINGNIIMEERKIEKVDEAKLLKDCESIIKRIKN